MDFMGDSLGYFTLLIVVCFVLGYLGSPNKELETAVNAVVEECPVYLDGEPIYYLKGLSCDDIKDYIRLKADFRYDADTKEVFLFSESTEETTSEEGGI